MTIEPDYTKWLSVEGLSPHEFACLYLGVEPPPIPVGVASSSSTCPTMPTVVGDRLDQRDWEQDYERVHTVLSRAIEDRAFPTTPSGRIKLADGVRYLSSIAEVGGWSDQLSSVPFIQRARGTVGNAESREDALTARVNELEEELARCKAHDSYSTPMLEMVKMVIEKFYSAGGDFPKQETVKEFLREQKTLLDGTELSEAKIQSIWAVASHPSQAIGGQKPRKKF